MSRTTNCILPALFPMCMLFFRQEGTAQSLTIYTIPPPRAINWSSPRKLVMSYLRNSLIHDRYGKQKHSIGHVLVELKDSTHYALVGTIAASKKYMTKLVVSKGYGLGIFLDTIPGKMQGSEENMPAMLQRCKTGDIAFVKYELSQEVFARLWQYLQEYQEKGYDKLYNGSNQPLNGGGAGCSAFGVSFLEVGGLKDLFPVDDWIIHVHAPEKLIGGPHHPGHHVSPIRLFFRNRWADEKKEPYCDITYYDPTVMFNQIELKYKRGFHANNISGMQTGNAFGFLIKCADRPAPTVPIWPAKR